MLLFCKKNKSISISKVFSLMSILEMFNLPLSQIAYDQVQTIQQLMVTASLKDNVDIWAYTGGSTEFSLARMYRLIVGHHQPDQAFRWVWKSFYQPKHKVFYWLLMKDRLSTRNILRRKNMHLESYNYELCN